MAAQPSDVVLVITGGDPVPRAHLPELPAGTVVVAADSGLHHAHALGLRVDLAVGDFDSVAPAALREAAAAGTAIERHPAAKDATDLELALDAALARSPARIHVLGGHGGRLDHLLANALVLARPQNAAATVTAQMGRARVAVVRATATLSGPVGDLVTLLPVGGPARGITTTGLRYPLHDEELGPGTTRGVSNELVAETATVTVADGVLLAIQPGAADDPRDTPEPLEEL
jgi:thiamine pyrophosphokinase